MRRNDLRRQWWLFPAAMAIAMSACTAPGGTIVGGVDPAEEAMAESALRGNGAPNGSHFTLNVIGVPKGKSMSTAGGSVIFVPETGSTKINLSEGDFAVLDKNCTDGSCQFQLPNPDPTNSGTTTYSVFARALGKPGGSSTSTTCATDAATGETFCSIYSSVQVRSTGKSTFTNVSRELLYLYADVDGDGTVERYNLFNDALMDYYWQYDNTGLKLLQYRFYPVPTTVN
jgi:hypothetical protein